MEVLANALLPRRISQIYADTKRSYEQIILRNNITNPELSTLNLKLRVQKDRLIAWGLEWADANASQSGDIDDSLDRAGISDLVASIMSSIRELLDEAERIQPRVRPLHPGAYPPEKAGGLGQSPWTPVDIARLSDIVKDITTSIDTLCDLSRSQQSQKTGTTLREEKPSAFTAKPKALDARGLKSSTPGTPTSDTFPIPLDTSDIISSSRIDPQNLAILETSNSPGAQPPPYDSVASNPSNRAFAVLKSRAISTSAMGKNSNVDKFVMIDFGQDFDSDVARGRCPSLKRFESLVLALQAVNADPDGHNYTGCLRILGWFADRRRNRFGFVYEISHLQLGPSPDLATLRPQTLMSYLQHGGDTDSANMPSLEDRFRLGFNLATNLLHTHAKGLTHRNINSNNVVFLEGGSHGPDSKPWREGVIRKPYLVSWDQSADDVDALQPELLVSSIYRHPKVDRGKRSTYRPCHDIYSLGLILLEIGIWMPIHKFWKSKYTLIDFQKRLQTVYSSKLSAKCGNYYMKAAHYCLTIADQITNDASLNRQSTNESQQAKLQTDFYWKVLKPLEKCCMLDESNEPILVPASSVVPERSNAENRLDAEVKRYSNPLSQLPARTTSLPSPGPQPQQRLQTDSPFQVGLKTELLVWSHKVPNATRAYFESVMMPKLGRMFARAIDRWESYEIDIFMAGETPETAKPTLLMVCRSIMRAWKILEYVNSDQNLFDIKVASGQINYSKNGKKRKKPRNINTSTVPNARTPSQAPSKHQQKPTCGASIGAFVDEQHLEAVTFGGIVLVDGEPFGMSVHHMLEDQDVDHGLDYVLDGPQSPPGLTESHDGSQYLDDDELDPDFFDRDFDDDEECFNLGDTLGTSPGKGRDLVVTQPALDDVNPDFFPNEEDMSDDHLSSHGLGYIHASSGLKQVKHGAMSHEVDWALFKVAEGRLYPQNVIKGGERFMEGADTSPQPCEIVRADCLGDRGVYAIGSKSGLASGKIWSNMTMTKMPGRVFASPVWRFNGGFGVGGDSGAWVIDNESGGLCGHVTAWSEYHQNGTISPMEVLLHDMEQTLGKPVALPVPDHAIPAQSYRQQIASVQPLLAIPPTIPPALPPRPVETFKGKGREASFDSNYGSDTEADTADTELDRAGTSCTSNTSPILAASPVTLAKDLSALSLGDVAEQWRVTQAQQHQQQQQTAKAIDERRVVGKEMPSTVRTELPGLTTAARC